MPNEEGFQELLEWFRDKSERDAEEVRAREASDEETRSIARQRTDKWNSLLPDLPYTADNYGINVDVRNGSAVIRMPFGADIREARLTPNPQGLIEAFFRSEGDRLLQQEGFSTPSERHCPLEWTARDAIIVALSGTRRELSRPPGTPPTLALRAHTEANVMVEFGAPPPAGGGLELYVTAPAAGEFTTAAPSLEHQGRNLGLLPDDCTPFLLSARRYRAPNGQEHTERILLQLLSGTALWIRVFDKDGNTLDGDFKIACHN